MMSTSVCTSDALEQNATRPKILRSLFKRYKYHSVVYV
jgi:hypothetical protein